MSENKVEEKWKSQIATTLTNRSQIANTRGSGTIVHIVKDFTIRTININGVDYICISDVARQKNAIDPNGVIGNWMRNRNTIEYLGLWETLHNPNFNPLEFEGFRNTAVSGTSVLKAKGARINQCGPL